MSKLNLSNVNEMFLKAHRKGVKEAIDLAARTNTKLIIQKGDKVLSVSPPYKYVRVPIELKNK